MPNTDVPATLGSWFLDPPAAPTRPPALTESEPLCSCCPKPPDLPAPVARPRPRLVVAAPDPSPEPAAPPPPPPEAPTPKPPKPKKTYTPPQYVQLRKTFRATCRLTRQRRRLSLVDFADAADVDMGTYAQIESGVLTRLKKETAHRIATFAGFDGHNHWRGE